MTPTIVVHGGAGEVDDSRVERALSGVADAVRAGLDVLRRGGSALDAAQTAVRALEDDLEFNAGTGAALSREGTVELDAAVMDGATLRFGAIGAVPNVKRPIELARLVLEDGEHCLLVGEAAWRFARERGVLAVAPGAMVTERSLRRLEQERARRTAGPRVPVAVDPGGGTVGACAIDAAGHVAAATSTGGITYKRPGRVGDTPLPGCGTYADDGAGAASATGHGESILRVLCTACAVEAMRAGRSAAEAASAAVDLLAARVAGAGGIICLDRRGGIGVAHNTVRMTFGWASLERPEPETGVAAPPSAPP